MKFRVSLKYFVKARLKPEYLEKIIKKPLKNARIKDGKNDIFLTLLLYEYLIII